MTSARAGPPRCLHWRGDQRSYCHNLAGVRLYLIGPRCPQHTPATVTGRSEPRSTALTARRSGSNRLEGNEMVLRADRQALLRNALDAATRGWHVFPLRPGDKRPAFPDHDADHCARRDSRCRAAGAHVGWEERATVDPDRIRRAWTHTPYNVGVACGPSGLVVVDLDTPKPGRETPPEAWRLDVVRDGTDVFTLVCERAGQPYPADTYTVATASEGTHLYFTHPDTGPALRNTSGDKGNGLGWLVDTRGHGGYVVAAGSVVDARPYTVRWDADPAPLPGWLADRLASPPLAARPPTTVNIGTGRAAAYLQAAIDRQIAHVTGVTSHRNDALFIAAANLGELVAGGALDAGHVEAVLTDAAHQVGLHLDPPPGQIRKTIASGLRAGARRPRRVPA
jgi:hypothetical protein